MNNHYVFLMSCPFYDYITSIFVSCCPFWLEVYFVWYEYGYICFIWLLFAWSIIFYPFTFEPICVFRAEMSLLEAAYNWVLFFNSSATLCLLIHEFNQFTFRVIIDKWELSNAILSFIFWLLCISVVSFFVCISVCHFIFMVFYDVFLSFLFLYVLCLCPRLKFCLYQMSHR